MAEKVEIDIPGIGKVKAENAASEATLAEILKILQGFDKKLGGKGGGGGGGSNKSQKDAEKGAKNLANAANDAADAAGKASSGSDKFAKAAITASHAAGKVVSGFGSLAKSTTEIISSLADMGDSLTSAAGVIGQLPIVGGVLGTVFGAVAKAAEGQLKAYQDMSSIGATFGGSMQDMNRAASGAGLTVEQFANVVKSNGEAMMLLGGTTEKGAKRFAELSKQVRANNEELLRMGYSTEQINSGMAGYLSIIGKTGALQNMTTSQIAASSAGYLKDLDALAKITGQTREEKQKEQEALMKDAQVRAAMAGMDAESQKQMMAYITSFPKEQQAAIKDMIATGNITSEEAIKLNALMPGAAQQAMQFGRTLQAGGKISKEAMNQAKNSAIQEAKINTQRYKDQGLYNKDMAETYVGMANLAAQEVDGLSKAYKEGADSAKKTNLAETLQKSKEKLAAFSNEMTNFLAQSGLLDAMMAAIKGIALFATTVLVPAFQVVGGVIKTLVPIIVEGLTPAFNYLSQVLPKVANFVMEKVLPVLGSLASTIIDIAVPVFNTLVSVVETLAGPVFSVLGSAVSLLGDVAQNYVIPAFNLVGSAITTVAEFVADNLQPILIGLGAALAGYVAVNIPALIAATMAQVTATWTSVTNIVRQTALQIPAMIAQTAAMWALVAPVLAAAAPFIAIGIAVGGALIWFKKLGGDIEVVGDGLSWLWSHVEDFGRGLKIVYYELRNMLSAGNEWKEKAEAERKAIEDNKKTRDDLEKKMSKRMEENREKAAEDERKREEEKKKAAEARENKKHQKEMGNIDAKEEREKKAAEATQEVIMSGPEAMLKSAHDLYTGKKAEASAPAGTSPSAPGTPSVGPQKAPSMTGNNITGLGRIAAQFESGGKAGTISTGHGDLGGKSYGAFQLSSKTGDVDKFLKSSGYASQFAGLQVGSADFDKKWKELAQTKEFADAQQAHAKKQHYDPQMAKLKKAGLDLSGKGAGVQEAIMSTANQYGANTELIQKALAGQDTNKMSDKDIINAIQDYKAKTVSTRFRSSSDAVRAGVAKRVEQERSALLAVDGQGGQATQLAQAKQKGLPSAASLETAKAALEKGKETLAAAPTTLAAPGTKEPTPKDLSVELLTALNNKMDQLIAISQSTAESSRSQLNAQRDIADGAGILV